MAKPKEKTDAEIALEFLVKALDAPNATYAPAIEIARLDSAEAILKYATPAESEFRNKAIDFLNRTMTGKVVSIGAAGRARAAAMLLRECRAVPA